MDYLHHLNKNLSEIRKIVEEIYDNFPKTIESIIRNVTAQMTITNAQYHEEQIDKIYNFILSLNNTLQGIADPWIEFNKLNDIKILDNDLGFQAGLGFLGCELYEIKYPKLDDNDKLFLKQMTNLYAIQQYVAIILSGTKSECDELYNDIYNHMLAFWICIKNKKNKKEKVIDQYLRVVIMKKPENSIDLKNCGIGQDRIKTLNDVIAKGIKMKEYKTFGGDTLKLLPSLSHLYFPFQNLLNNIEILKETLKISLNTENKDEIPNNIPKYLLYIRLFKNPDTKKYEWKVTDTTLFKQHLNNFLKKDDPELQRIFQLPEDVNVSHFGAYKNKFIEKAIEDLFLNITKRSIITEEIIVKNGINTPEKLNEINKKRTPKYPEIPPFQFQDLNSLKSDPSALAEQLFKREIDVSEICGITGNEIVYVKDETHGY